MSDLKARVGEPITAGKWNRVVDRLESTTAGFSAGGFVMSRVECRIKNDSGANREFGEVLVIDDFDGPITNDIFLVSQNIVYSCVTPVWHTAVDRLVVLAEPIPDGEYGKAVLSGQCIARTTSVIDSDTYLMVHPEYPNRLKGGSSGQAKLLHKLTLTDYAIVNLGEKQPLWRYSLRETSASPGTTKIALQDLDGIGWGIGELHDRLVLTYDQPAFYSGLCMLAGNQFHAIHPERYVHPPIENS